MWGGGGAGCYRQKTKVKFGWFKGGGGAFFKWVRLPPPHLKKKPMCVVFIQVNPLLTIGNSLQAEKPVQSINAYMLLQRERAAYRHCTTNFLRCKIYACQTPIFFAAHKHTQ